MTADPGYRIVGRMPEKIHTDNKQNHIHHAGNDNPFPQPVFANKIMGFKKRLYGNDNFFKQALDFMAGKYNRQSAIGNRQRRYGLLFACCYFEFLTMKKLPPSFYLRDDVVAISNVAEGFFDGHAGIER